MRDFLMRRKWDFLGVSLSVVLGAVLIYVNLTVVRPRKHQVTCQSNLKQIGLGFMQYIRDYDERYPLANNWQKGLWTYTRSESIFHCPERAAAPNDYAFHKRIADIEFLSVVQTPATYILVFESDAAKLNACDYGSSLPRAPRHPDGHNILFADGHVKALAKPNFTADFNSAIDFPLRDKMRKHNADWWREILQRDKMRLARTRRIIAWQKKRKQLSQNKQANPSR